MTTLQSSRERPRFDAYSDLLAAAVVVAGLCWRLWLAHATFFNTDEAWHFSVANQDSLAAAYRASLTLAHPPLLIFVLYFWKHLGTSDVFLRLPGVLAGTAFCWVFYKWLTILFKGNLFARGVSARSVAWCGLIFAAFLPPMIVLSAELRQYSWMLLFATSSAYFLERSLNESLADHRSLRMMWASSLCLWLAMLSHYSAFLFAASLGIYAIVRIIAQRPPKAVMASWAAGQVAGVALAAFLVKTHVSKLGSVYPGEPLHRFGDFYLSSWYFHPGRDNLFRFLWRGTFGVFRFTFGQTALGQIAALLFVVGVVLLFREKPGSNGVPRPRMTALLLLLPFALSWIAVFAGLYPYGRTRHCIFLAVFGLAGVGFALSKISAGRLWVALAVSAAIVAGCHLLGTLQGRDMLPIDEQRHEDMDRALALIRSEVSPRDVIFTDKATALQLGHYLCHQKPVHIEFAQQGFESFRCDGRWVVATGPNDTELRPETFAARLADMKRIYSVAPDVVVWVAQGGWASNLGETLRTHAEFSGLELHRYDRYLEVFKLPSAR